MNAFDIIGPDMIGPSSSHTAGAVRIGNAAANLLKGTPKKAKIGLYGSFAKTGKGHGTPMALVAGMLGMKPNDPNIKNSFAIADDNNFEYEFYDAELEHAHPNTAVILLESDTGKTVNLQASSIGGGKIRLDMINGLPVNILGEYTTILITNDDRTGVVAAVSSLLSWRNINIANFELNRDTKGKTAMMSIKIDGNINNEDIKMIETLPGVISATVFQIGSV